MQNDRLKIFKLVTIILGMGFSSINVGAISINKQCYNYPQLECTPPHAVDYDNYQKPYLLINYRNGKQSFCSSVMISPRRLLTARHCTEPDEDGSPVDSIAAVFPIAENNASLKIYFGSAYYPNTHFDEIYPQNPRTISANNLVETIPILPGSTNFTDKPETDAIALVLAYSPKLYSLYPDSFIHPIFYSIKQLAKTFPYNAYSNKNYHGNSYSDFKEYPELKAYGYGYSKYLSDEEKRYALFNNYNDSNGRLLASVQILKNERYINADGTPYNIKDPNAFVALMGYMHVNGGDSGGAVYDNQNRIIGIIKAPTRVTCSGYSYENIFIIQGFSQREVNRLKNMQRQR